MKLAKRLGLLESAAIWSLRREYRNLQEIKTSTPTKREVLISPLVINVLNTWANFNRTYYLCCLKGARSGSGLNIISPHSNLSISVNDSIGLAISSTNSKATPLASGLWDTRDEPTWHDANTIMSLAQKLSFSNSSDIQTAFTFGFTAHRDFVVFRNYYGHRNQGTKRKAQNMAASYGINSSQHPSEILLDSPISSPGVSLLEKWLSEFEQTISLLCS